MGSRSAAENPLRLVHAEGALLAPVDDFGLLEPFPAVLDQIVRGFPNRGGTRLTGGFRGKAVGLITVWDVCQGFRFTRALALQV